MSLQTPNDSRSSEPEADSDTAQNHEELSNLRPDELLDRMQALQAETTRLQALVCYLVHTNEELRQRNGMKSPLTNARDSQTERA